MPLNSLNKEALSFKKLFGKAHTNQGFAIVSETITSNIQIASTTIFAEPINPLPVTDGGLNSLGDTDGIVEKIRFEIDIIPDTLIGTNQSQGYRLKLPAGYSGVLASEFSGGTFLHTALGKLQIVPPLYGTLKSDGTTEYDPVVFEGDGTTIIPKLSEIDFNLDLYNGILFVQDPPVGFDISSSRPSFLEAYLYVGDYLDSFSGGTSGSTASGERIESTIGQTTHNFVVGDVLSATGGTYIKALARADQPEPLGIVTQVNTADEFVLTYAGFTDTLNLMTDENGLQLSGDTIYYVSDDSAGKLQIDPPVSVNDVIKPILYVVDEANTGNIFQMRGSVISSGSSSSSGVTVINSGTGEPIGIVPNAGDTVELRTLLGSGGTSVTQVGDEIIISSSGSSALRETFRTTTANVSIPNSTVNSHYVASGSTGFTFPASPLEGAIITVTDGLGNADVSNVSIDGNGQNILNDTSALINTNYGSITFEYNGVFWSVTSSVP